MKPRRPRVRARRMAVVFAALCLFALSACSGAPEQKPASPAQTGSPLPSAALALQVDVRAGERVTQIPIFLSREGDAAIAQLNARIDAELMPLYRSSAAEGGPLPEIRCKLLMDERYLQAVVDYYDTPHEVGDGAVATYLYDREKQAVITLEDALAAARLDEAGVGLLIEEYSRAHGMVLQGWEWAGCFYDGEDWRLLVYLTVDEGGGEPWRYLYDISPRGAVTHYMGKMEGN